LGQNYYNQKQFTEVTVSNVHILYEFITIWGRGWSETHYSALTGAPGILDNALTVAKIVAVARAQLLGEDCTLATIRASYQAPSQVIGKSIYPELKGTQGVAGTSWSNSLAAQMRDATGGLKKVIHVRGFPNFLVSDEEYLVPAGAAGNLWRKTYGMWVGALVSANFGWLTTQPTSFYGLVTGYVINPNGTVTLSVQPTAGSGPAPVSIGPWSVRCSRINKSNSILNRTFVYTYNIANGTFTSLNPIGAAPFTGTGKFKLSVTAFTPYATIWQTELGQRRMGKVTGLYPGRGRRRPVN
jgi:hypothetical protein